MQLSYTSGNVVLDAPMPFGWTIEEGDPTAFVFKLLINGNIGSISAPAGSLPNSGKLTLKPASLGTHVIEAFAAGSNPDVDPPFAQGPTFTVVAPSSLSSTLSSTPGAPSPATLSAESSQSPQSTMIIEETASATKHVDKLAFAGAGIGAAIILAVVLAVFLVHRRIKRRLSPVDAAITQWANSPTVEPFVTFPDMGEISGRTHPKASSGDTATDRVDAEDGLREARISATPFRFSVESLPPNYSDIVAV